MHYLPKEAPAPHVQVHFKTTRPYCARTLILCNLCMCAQIHDKAPKMLMVDLLFWKDHHAAAAIDQDYWLWVGGG